jgi:hypothetical protein
MRTVLIRAAAVLASLWLVFVGCIGWAMHQSPETFGRVMSRMPTVTYILFPFESMWTRARAGSLHAGDVAPDFSLATLDKKETVHLAAFREKSPVVLVFGSYT